MIFQVTNAYIMYHRTEIPMIGGVFLRELFESLLPFLPNGTCDQAFSPCTCREVFMLCLLYNSHTYQ